MKSDGQANTGGKKQTSSNGSTAGWVNKEGNGKGFSKEYQFCTLYNFFYPSKVISPGLASALAS